MGDVDDGHRIMPQEIIQCFEKSLPVGPVKALAGFIENQQQRLLNKCAGKQDHTLQPGRKGQIWASRNRQQPQTLEPFTSDTAFSRTDLPWWANDILETRLHHLEACHFPTEIEMQLGRYPADATLDLPNGFASASLSTKHKNSIGV